LICFNYLDFYSKVFRGPSMMLEKHFVLITIGMVSFVVAGLQIFFYVKIFLSILHHNNSVAVNLIAPRTLQTRNRSNSISFVTQIIICLLQVLYIAVSVLVKLYGSEFTHQISSLLKMTEFCLIPMIQVATTPSFRKTVTPKLSHYLICLGKIKLCHK